MYVCIVYIYIQRYVYVYMYIYIYIQCMYVYIHNRVYTYYQACNHNHEANLHFSWGQTKVRGRPGISKRYCCYRVHMGAPCQEAA